LRARTCSQVCTTKLVNPLFRLIFVAIILSLVGLINRVKPSRVDLMAVVVLLVENPLAAQDLY
jgi:hypothetical protein